MNEAKGPNSILKKISIKDLNDEISKPLFNLNLSFNTGVSPYSLKLERVIPEFLLCQVLEK